MENASDPEIEPEVIKIRTEIVPVPVEGVARGRIERLNAEETQVHKPCVQKFHSFSPLIGYLYFSLIF